MCWDQNPKMRPPLHYISQTIKQNSKFGNVQILTSSLYKNIKLVLLFFVNTRLNLYDVRKMITLDITWNKFETTVY
jgi:hypothetical protein